MRREDQSDFPTVLLRIAPPLSKKRKKKSTGQPEKRQFSVMKTRIFGEYSYGNFTYKTGGCESQWSKKNQEEHGMHRRQTRPKPQDASATPTTTATSTMPTHL